MIGLHRKLSAQYAEDAYQRPHEFVGGRDIEPKDGHLLRYVAWCIEEGTWSSSVVPR